MADLTITSANIRTETTTVIEKVQYGETVAIGDLLYLKASDSKWYIADGNDTFEKAGQNGLAFNLLVGDLDDYGFVVTSGPFEPGSTPVEGTIYVASANAGKIAPASDQTTGWWGAIVGIGMASNKLHWKPFIIDEVRP